MSKQFEELKAAALAIGHERWVQDGSSVNTEDYRTANGEMCCDHVGCFEFVNGESPHAKYVASASPAVVLELLAALEEKDRRIAELSVGKVGNALLEREKHHAEVVGNLSERIAELERELIKPLSIGELIQRLESQAGEKWCSVPAIRQEHAEWSSATFGNVGPVGPLKHLSKEALEAAADPQDLSEWADMLFLFWDAQRRAGITDEQIENAMIEKLAVNKARSWPEPKDGEPRLHIKA